jgi:putative toxin-antitoxin system antitoxin component (TIGR02293 family)
VQKAVDLPQNQLAHILGIPPRSLVRKKEKQRLTAMESDRLNRIIWILAVTVDILGDIEKARVWLKRTNRGLGGEIPLNLLATEHGARHVEDVLRWVTCTIYG